MVDKLVGFELGWDHARHSVEPPAEHMDPSLALRQGYEAGRASFGARARMASPAARCWLQLRLHAWLRGRSFELMSVTPNYLQQLQTSHCPVTRTALTDSALRSPHGAPSDATLSRICDDAAYAAGNLAMLSLAAEVAKADLGHTDAFEIAQHLDARDTSQHDGLDAPAWRRLGVLLSFVTPLSHAQAAKLPLLVFPPNRLHLLNPVQALQVLCTRLLTLPDRSERIHTLLGLLPSPAAREQFQHLMQTLQAHAPAQLATQAALEQRHALEDLWRVADVHAQWQHFATQLNAPQAETLLVQAAHHGLCTQRVVVHSADQATAGWALDTRGYLPADAPAPLTHPRRVKSSQLDTSQTPEHPMADLGQQISKARISTLRGCVHPHIALC